ncbi:hypothetical protein [Sulfurovum sp. NBC37-1]|uniref:hypothetical protein n=1 Tax=Sulfurovum sp. (strain NBC37-1) TaxID=387093 RepID=UPI0001587B05|nr:hypothetical protein [Sulfurovum sp. NBC37-1]BAF73349.1 hypothetical protein SUN_2413 [Sulfurovum sp. NBC37-1]
MNANTNNEEAIRELDAIVNTYGIDVIREYLKSYNKQARRKQKKGNKKDEVAIDVYNLIMSGEYDLAHAIIEISIQRDTSDATVKNHKNAFYQQAKQDYLRAYEIYLKTYDANKNFVGIELTTSWSGYEELYSTIYEHMENYTQEKLKIYYYLFNDVFLDKKDVKEKIKKLEENVEIPF